MPRLTKSQREVESIVEMVAIALAQKKPKYVIKGLIRGKIAELSGVKPEDVSARTCESYLSQARELILKSVGKPAAELFLEAVCFYRAVIQDERSSPYVQMRARERLDILFGLNPPVRREVAGNDQTPLTVTADAIIAAHNQARRSGEAED